MQPKAHGTLLALATALLLPVFAASAQAAAGKGTYTLFVLNDAASGMETEFNRWYDQQHAQDVLINPTYLDSQRYVASARQLRAGASAPNKYAIQFTIETSDIARSLGYIHENIRSGRTVPTSTIARGDGRGGDFVYLAITDVMPGNAASSKAIGAAQRLRRFLQVEFSTPSSDDATAFQRRFDSAMAPRIAALPGVVSWQRFEISPQQLTTKMDIAERFMTLIEFELPDDAAIDQLQAQFTSLENTAPGDTGKVVRSVTYEVLGPLLSGADVKRERAAAAEAARPGAGLRPELRASAYVTAPGDNRPPSRPASPRLAPLSDAQATAAQRAIIGKYAAAGQDGNVLRTLAWSAQRPDQFFPLFNYIENQSSVPARDRELLILRTAWLTQSAYLWARHAGRATQTGLTAEAIRSAATRSALAWGSFDAVLFNLADELFRNSSITDRTWQALVDKYGVKPAMDAVVTVTHMTEAAIVFNSLGIQPDTASTTRLPTEDAYSVVAAQREPDLAVARVQPVAGTGLAITRTLRQNTELAAQWYANPDTAPNQSQSPLSPHDRELAILRMGWNCQSVYEWAQHVGSVGRARDHGLEPRDIAIGVAASNWTDRDRTLITAVDEMYRDSMISEASWKKLTAIFDTDQLLTFVATAARYRRVSMTLNALGVQPSADDERLPVLTN